VQNVSHETTGEVKWLGRLTTGKVARRAEVCIETVQFYGGKGLKLLCARVPAREGDGQIMEAAMAVPFGLGV
jgi:hypothetical protein